jgi:DNA-binding SARP family transcriptional activator
MRAVTGTLRDARPNRYRYGVPPRQRSAPQLDIRLMGPPEVLVRGTPLMVDTRKAVAVLALLGAEGRPFARDEIAALLWPDSDDAAARGALRRTLSTLRTAIGDGPLRIDRTRVDLDRGQVHVDLDEIERASRSDDRGVLEAATKLARGAFLAGFNLRDSPEFDDWRAARAVAVERSVLAVFDRLASVAQEAGDLAAAIEAASRRLDLDPLDEAGHVRLMDLHLAAGDRAAALRQYRACVAVLDRELGVAPLASTTELYEAIRAEPGPDRIRPGVASATAPESMGGLARALPFVGRDDALRAILRVRAEVASTGSGRLVAIVGEAGVGKTRLAAEAFGRLRTDGATILGAVGYPAEQAIAYAPIVDMLRAALADAATSSRLGRLPAATRRELARLLPAVDPRAGGSPAAGDTVGAHARLIGAIADGLTALVTDGSVGALWMDDVQWLDASSLEALGYLVRRLAGRPVLLLLAWRAEDLDGDVVDFARRVTSGADAIVIELDRLGAADVTRLVASGIAPAKVDAEFAERLAVASEGLPLYVVEALAAGSSVAPESMPSGVETVLRMRVASVSEPAAQVLGAASVIGRSFDLATVRYASGRSDDETADAVDELLRRRLIREGLAGLDFAHAAIREHVYGSISMQRRRLLHRRVAEALRRDLGAIGRDDLARIVGIAAHERAAGRDAAAADAYRDASIRAAGLFANREAIEHAEAALALGHPDVVGLHAEIGRLRTRLGDYPGAIAALESAAALAAPAELPSLEWALGRAHLRRGDLVAAEHHLAAAMADRSGRSRDSANAAIARILVDRSVVSRRAGDEPAARAAAERALQVAVGAGDPAAQGAADRILGLLALDGGEPTTAVAHLLAAVEAAANDPDPTARIAALASLALAEAAAGALDAGLVHGEEAVVASRAIGDRHLEAAVENHLADILHAAGRDDESRVHLTRAIEAFAEVGGDPADPDPGIWMLSAS